MTREVTIAKAKLTPVRVLIVDDDEASRRNFQSGLEDLGYKVTLAANGQEALEKFPRNAFDIVLVDLRMPVMGGMELIANLKEKSPLTPVVLVSGSGILHDAVKAIRQGAWDYVTKPVQDLNDLDVVMLRSLERARLLRDNLKYQEHLEELVDEQTGQLRASEEKFSKAFRASPTAKVITTLSTGAIIDANESFEKLVGFSQEELANRNLIEFWAIPAEIDRMFKRLATDRCVRDVEYQLRAKGGRLLTTRYSAEIIELDGEQSVLSVFIDLTEAERKEEEMCRLLAQTERARTSLLSILEDQKQITEALRDSETRKSAMLESALDCIITVDESEKIVEFNPSAEKTFGYSRQAVIGQRLSDLIIPPAFRERHREGMRSLLAGGDSKMIGQRVEITALREDGSEFPAELAITRVPRPGSCMYTAFLRDITQRKLTEKALRESEERLSLALRSTTDGFWDWNVKTDDVFISSRFKELLGFSEDELPNRFESFTKQVHPDDLGPAMDHIQSFFRTRARSGFELRLRTKAGEYRWFSMRAEAVWNAAGEAVRLVGSTTDITERKRAEEEHVRLEEQLRQAQKMEAIGTLAGGIAHDFNNILTAVIAYTDLARMDVGDQKPVGGYLGNVMRACDRAKELVSQILTFSRQQKQERRPGKLQAIIKEVLMLLRSALPASIRIVQEISEQAPVVLMDQGQIHQVLMNLCTNAAHAMRDRPGILRISLNSCLVDADLTRRNPDLVPGPYARLSVSDSGCGMTPETLTRIFDPFFTTKAPGEGTGLGLAVVHGILKEHNGGITVQSELGLGTTFDLFFPAHEAEELLSELPPPDAPRGTGEKILLIDDEMVICFAAQHILERHGYEVVTESDSQAALARFRSAPERFDLVITDLNMPGMPGNELAIQILRTRPRLPVLLATGFSGTWTNEKVRELGLSGLVMKPFSANELSAIVHQTLHHDRQSKV